jgi:hypothetical protein
MDESRFTLRIDAGEYRQYYRGAVRYVQVMDHRGRRVRFPASLLQPFVSHSGVEGQFVLRYDDAMRAHSLEKL